MTKRPDPKAEELRQLRAQNRDFRMEVQRCRNDLHKAERENALLKETINTLRGALEAVREALTELKRKPRK